MVARAVAAFRAGQGRRAVKDLQRHLKTAPGDGQARLTLGEILYRQDDHRGAQRQLAKACELLPQLPAARNLLGLALIGLGKLEPATQAFQAATGLDPQSADAWFNLAGALLLANRVAAGLAACETAAALAPGDPHIGYRLGDAQRRAGRFEAAARTFERVLAQHPDPSAPRLALAQSLAAAEQAERAGREIERILGAAPGHVPALSLRADLHKQLGELEAAALAYRRVLEAEPHDGAALLSLARLGREADRALVVERAEAGLRRRPDGERTAALHYALANVLEAEGEPERAFEQFQAGARACRRGLDFDLAAERAAFAEIKSVFDAERLARSALEGDPSERPILIVGMPRSGTTLVEQILASHSQVAAGGELPYLRRLELDFADLTGTTAAFPAAVAELRAADLAALGRDYAERLAALAQGQARTTDKAPLNFKYLGLLALMLPAARILHCRRAPLDTCLSCFTTLFAPGRVPFSYDLEELGGYHRLYDDLMAHWQQVLPTPMSHELIEVDYEALVAEPEPACQALLAKLGLPWEDGVLRFHERKGAVATASAVQVRSPISSRSVGRWRRYEAQLGPLKTALNREAS